MSDRVHYDVDLTDRVQHLVHVTMTVPQRFAPDARIEMATWTPGSYVLRHYARHVQWISATDDRGPVACVPEGLGAWRLATDIEGDVRVELELYANELSVRTNHVDDHHALLVAAATFPFVAEARDVEHTVAFPGIDDTPVHALLPVVDGSWRARDLDHLIDSAFEVGDFPSVTFDVAGVAHTFVWSGHGRSPDLDRLADDVTAIAEASCRVFDTAPPAASYTFLCTGWDQGGGGLEHRDGAVLQVPVHAFGDDDRYARVLALIAHEYFHQWNVTRMTPAALTRPDYTHATLSASLWVAEGWTAYYDELLVTRAARWNARRFVDHLAEAVATVDAAPGTLRHALRDASNEAWIKHYLPTENAVNATTDYYQHGAVVAFELDLRLRAAGIESGLDAVARALWQRFGDDSNGYDEADVLAMIAAVGGDDIAERIDARVGRPSGPEIDNRLLSTVGLQWQTRPSSTPDLGAQVRDEGGRVVVASVFRDRPAWRAGMTGGDEMLALDGTTVITAKELDAALATYNAGDTIAVTVRRGPRVRTLDVALAAPRPARRLVPDPDASLQATAQFTAWTGHDLASLD
ncbi:MAG: PDZ domain-containing protein [Nitriliruptoraceae bacterium]